MDNQLTPDQRKLRAKELRDRFNKNQEEMISNLRVIHQHKLYIELGYKSMYEYCHEMLGYDLPEYKTLLKKIKEQPEGENLENG
jgi:hypothetical protein